ATDATVSAAKSVAAMVKNRFSLASSSATAVREAANATLRNDIIRTVDCSSPLLSRMPKSLLRAPGATAPATPVRYPAPIKTCARCVLSIDGSLSQFAGMPSGDCHNRDEPAAKGDRPSDRDATVDPSRGI